MWVEIALLAWTGSALLWWILSLVVITRRPVPPLELAASPSTPSFLSIFKPLPRMDDEANLQKTSAALRSFFQQVNGNHEILVGLHAEEKAKWQPFFQIWRHEFPEASFQVVEWQENAPYAKLSNPKVAWQHQLARQARGDLWLWSDADITAPVHYLKEACAEFYGSGAGLLTHAYLVRKVVSVPDLLNALFVNVEIYPGARLLGRNREIFFGLGAGLLFSKKDFEKKIEWPELGSRLADDFYLGTHLPPARLGSTILETYSGSATLPESILHYLRWQKTIRWCNPLGFAAQISILPMAGWFLFTLFFPLHPLAWAGFMSVALGETLWVALLFRFTGCRPPLRFYGLIPVWSFFRVLAFLACWLPWPVIWRSQAWWGPVRRDPST